MIRAGDKVFVDSGAWIALAEAADPLHERAAAHWQDMTRGGARPCTSVPVILETFTFLDRRGSRNLALRWRASLDTIRRFEVMACSAGDLGQAWPFLERKEFHRLSLVDATSFVLMQKHRIRIAFAFDAHFDVAGFRCLA